jgi:hypothetical protein
VADREGETAALAVPVLGRAMAQDGARILTINESQELQESRKESN